MTDIALSVSMIPIGRVIPADDNPREDLGDLDELVESIKSIGIIEPLIVVPNADTDDFTIVAGHRRHAAADDAGLDAVPCVIRAEWMGSDVTRHEAMFIENFHRLDLGPLEKARALQQLADDGLSQREIGAKVGISQGHVSKLLALLKLPEKARAWVAEEKLSQEDAASLAGLPAKTVEAICAEGVPNEWRIRRARDQAEAEKAKAKLVKEIQAKGWTILDGRPDPEPDVVLDGTSDPAALDTDRHDPFGTLAHVDPAEHESQPCHAVHIGWNNRLEPACTNPSAHPRPEGWKSAHEIELETEGEDEQDGPIQGHRPSAAEKLRHRRQLGVEAALGSLTPLAAQAVAVAGDASDFVLDYCTKRALEEEELFYSGHFALAGELLGVEVPARWDDQPAALVKAFSEPGGPDSLQVLYAVVLASTIDLVGRVLLDAQTAPPAGVVPDDHHLLEDALGFLAHLDEMVDDVPSLVALALSAVPKGETEAAVEDGAPAEAGSVQEPEGSDQAEGPEVESGDDEEAGSIQEGGGEEPTVEVYKKTESGKRWLFRCSACGPLDGFTTSEAYAKERGKLHLSEAHGVDSESEAVA